MDCNRETTDCKSVRSECLGRVEEERRKEEGDDMGNAEKMKPVNCGCGGHVYVYGIKHNVNASSYVCECVKCGISTRPWETEAEAVQEWNLAMSGNARECAKDARCSERTAKGEYSNADGEYLCSECGRVVQIEDAYCCGCGARLL